MQPLDGCIYPIANCPDANPMCDNDIGIVSSFVLEMDAPSNGDMKMKMNVHGGFMI